MSLSKWEINVGINKNMHTSVTAVGCQVVLDISNQISHERIHDTYNRFLMVLLNDAFLVV